MAEGNLAELFTGLATDAHGSQAGIPGLMKANSSAAPKLGQLLSHSSGGSSGMAAGAMGGAGMNRMGGSLGGAGPRPASPMMPGTHPLVVMQAAAGSGKVRFLCQTGYKSSHPWQAAWSCDSQSALLVRQD